MLVENYSTESQCGEIYGWLKRIHNENGGNRFDLSIRKRLEPSEKDMKKIIRTVSNYKPR